MISGTEPNAAVLAAIEAERLVAECVAAGRSFLLEAGAGAGKTYSLVEVLKSLIVTKGAELNRTGRRIACLTYTNVATNVIKARIDGNPLVFVDTIHAFCWSLIKGFQPALRKEVAALQSWQVRLAEVGGLGKQTIGYDKGWPRITDDIVSLHHDDVLSLTVALMSSEKFRQLLAAKYPVILIDEYQDTNRSVMEAIKVHLLGRKEPLIGLFGDHWQRIYDKTCGHVAHPALTEIGKKANFRSATAIVNALNRIRPELPQAFKDANNAGTATVHHTNSFKGERRKERGGHWTGDLPEDIARAYLKAFVEKLSSEGWEFSAEKTKILLLTHNLLAAEQGYSQLAKALDDTDLYIKKEDEHIAYFTDVLEPACAAYQQRRYGAMFSAFSESKPSFRTHADKERLASFMAGLVDLRLKGTIQEVSTFIQKNGFPCLPDGLLRNERDAETWNPEGGEEPPRRVARTRALMAVPYSEVIAVDRFIDGHTPYATKHSVKGDQFENVLVVFGRGWNHYDFNRYLEWAANPSRIPIDKLETFERYRNLFYVCCSRPTTRLALLFTQELSQASLECLRNWFGRDAVNGFSL